MSKTKIQLVLEDEVRLKGEELAQKNGLNSYQDLIRYWTVQASKGNLEVKTNFIEEELITPEMEKKFTKIKLLPAVSTSE